MVSSELTDDPELLLPPEDDFDFPLFDEDDFEESEDFEDLLCAEVLLSVTVINPDFTSTTGMKSALQSAHCETVHPKV